MVHIIPNFLDLHLGENFMKIRTKIAELQIHENLHKNVNVFIHIFMQIFMSFMKGNKATNMLQLYAANFNLF